MLALRAAVASLLVVAAAPAAAAGAGPTPAKAKGAVLRLRNLPKGTRVEIDGTPVADPAAPIPLAPGSYLVDVYPPAAPTLETFVDLAPGAHREITYRGGPPPDPIRVPPPAYGQALVGAGVVAALASATWWLLADASAGAEARVLGRTDLSQATQASMVADLEARETTRRSVSLAAGVTAGVLLVGGAVLWRVLDAGAPVQPAVAAVPGGAMAGLTLRLP